MRKTILLSLTSALLAALVPWSAGRAAIRVDVVMFYGQGCSHCASMEAHLKQFGAEHPELVLHVYEVFNDQGNLELFRRFAAAYGISASGVPTLFIGDQAVVGDRPDQVDRLIEECGQAGCISPFDVVPADSVGEPGQTEQPASTPQTEEVQAAAPPPPPPAIEVPNSSPEPVPEPAGPLTSEPSEETSGLEPAEGGRDDAAGPASSPAVADADDALPAQKMPLAAGAIVIVALTTVGVLIARRRAG